MKTKKVAAIVLAAVLALAACGSDDDDGASSDEGAGASLEAPAADTEATLRVWLNGPDTPDEMIDLAKETVRRAVPERDRRCRAARVGRPGQPAHQRPAHGRQPRHRRDGQHPGPGVRGGRPLVDLSDAQGDLGGDDLVDSLVEAGTYDGQFYGVPYYGGARIVVYRKDLFQKPRA